MAWLVLGVLVVVGVIAVIVNRRQRSRAVGVLSLLVGTTVTLGITQGGRMAFVFGVECYIDRVEDGRAFVTVFSVEPYDSPLFGLPSSGNAAIGLERITWVEHGGQRTRL